MGQQITASELRLGDRIAYGNSTAVVEGTTTRGSNVHLVLNGTWGRKYPVWPKDRGVYRYSTWDEQHADRQARTWQEYTASLRYAKQAEEEHHRHLANAIGWASRG